MLIYPIHPTHACFRLVYDYDTNSNVLPIPHSLVAFHIPLISALQ